MTKELEQFIKDLQNLKHMEETKIVNGPYELISEIVEKPHMGKFQNLILKLNNKILMDRSDLQTQQEFNQALKLILSRLTSLNEETQDTEEKLYTVEDIEKLILNVQGRNDIADHVINYANFLDDWDHEDMRYVIENGDSKYFFKLDTIVRDTIIKGIEDYFKVNLNESKNPLKDAEEFAKKHQKGLGAFVKLNAGNVEKGMETFNKNMGDTTSTGETQGMGEKMNIREELNKIDMDTCETDLVNMYEACKLTNEDKKQIVTLLQENKVENLTQFLESKLLESDYDDGYDDIGPDYMEELKAFNNLIKVRGPISRGAEYPTFVETAINESEIPDNMRFKMWDNEVISNDVIEFTWVTQEDFSSEDSKIFLKEIKRAIEALIASSRFDQPFTISLEVRPRSGEGHLVYDLNFNQDLNLKEDTNEMSKIKLDGLKQLIINTSDKMHEVIEYLEHIEKEFDELGIHSADIAPYITNKIEDFANLEESGYDLNLAELYERVEEYIRG